MRERALLSALPGADHCIVCGSSNPIGLRLQFWTEDERVVSEFVARPEFQGFDNLFQGGVLSAILDDLMVRTIWRHHGLNVTGKMEVTFRRPIRIGTAVRVEGEAAEPRSIARSRRPRERSCRTGAWPRTRAARSCWWTRISWRNWPMAESRGAYWDARMETLPRAALADLQLAWLQWQVRRCHEGSDFLAPAPGRGRTQPGGPATLDDYRRVPPLSADDLRIEQAAYPPFGRGVVAPRALWREALPVGPTTQPPLWSAWSEADVHARGAQAARLLWQAGVRPDDVLLVHLDWRPAHSGVAVG